MRAILGAALALAFGSVAAATAQEVVLRSHDGGITLTGMLEEFDGETILLDTAIGTIRVDAFQVTCEGAACPPADALRPVFRISGSNVLGAALMPALIEGFAFEQDADLLREPLDAMLTRFIIEGESPERPLAEIVLAAPGSSQAFAELLAREALIGMSSRPVRQDEASALRAAGLGDPQLEGREHVVALDGLLVLVAPGNPLRTISMADLAAVFSGRVANWSEIGGPDLPISLHLSSPEHGTRAMFEDLVMDPYGAEVAPEVTEHAIHADLSDAVASDPGAIGIAGFADRRNARALDLRLECGLVARPDEFSIKSEEYPLSRRLFLYTPDRPMPPQARALVEFATSEAAQPFISEAGFIDQAITAQGLEMQGMRLATTLVNQDRDVPYDDIRGMVETLIDAERLSITLRFEAGASLLDIRARADVRRLGRLIAEGAFDGKELLLVGFTDSVGRGDLNRALSERRAAQVRAAILEAAGGPVPGVALTTLGYGEMSPLGCNETFEGRRVNRRVELWLRDRS